MRTAFRFWKRDLSVAQEAWTEGRWPKHGFIFKLYKPFRGQSIEGIGSIGEFALIEKYSGRNITIDRKTLAQDYKLRRCPDALGRLLTSAGRPLVESVITLQEKKRSILEAAGTKKSLSVHSNFVAWDDPERYLLSGEEGRLMKGITQQVDLCEEALSRLYHRAKKELDIYGIEDDSIKKPPTPKEILTEEEKVAVSNLIEKTADQTDEINRLLDAFDSRILQKQENH